MAQNIYQLLLGDALMYSVLVAIASIFWYRLEKREHQLGDGSEVF